MFRNIRLFTLVTMVVTLSTFVLVSCSNNTRTTTPTNDITNNNTSDASDLALQVSSVCMSLTSPFEDHHETDSTTDLFSYTAQQSDATVANFSVDNNSDQFMIDFLKPGTNNVTLVESPTNNTMNLTLEIDNSGDISIEIVSSFSGIPLNLSLITPINDPNNILAASITNNKLSLGFTGSNGTAVLKITDPQLLQGIPPVELTLQTNCMAKLTLRKAIHADSDDGYDESTVFNFNYNDTSVQIDQSQQFSSSASVFNGPFEVTVNEVDLPAYWTLDSINCENAPSTITISDNGFSGELAGGDDVTCTFKNKYTAPPQIAKLTIVKTVDASSDENYPDDGFSFYTESPLGVDNPILKVGESKTYTSTPGPFQAKESNPLPTHWTLVDVNCVNANAASTTVLNINASNEFSANLLDGDDVTCTFTNKYRVTPRLTIVKKVDANSDQYPEDAEFTFSWNMGDAGSATNFQLGIDEEMVFTEFGFYSIFEEGSFDAEGNLNPAWQWVEVECVNANPSNPFSNIGYANIYNGISVFLFPSLMPPHDDVTCTVTNRYCAEGC